MSHLRRAHYDENRRVNEHWKQNMPSLRIPASGGGRFKGDILAFGLHKIILELVRRNETGEESITFTKEEIEDVMKLATNITEKVHPLQVVVLCVAHFVFPRGRGMYGSWITKQLIDWDGKNVVVKIGK